MRVLRIVASRRLPCGCLAGVYETYAGTITTLIDDRGPKCPDPTHKPGRPVPSGREPTNVAPAR